MLLKIGTYQLSFVNDRPDGQADSSWTRRIWQGLREMASLLSQPDELRIRQRRSGSGELLWDVYDPQTGRSASFITEDELMIWLDNRYNSVDEDLSRKLALTYPTFR